MGLEECGDGQWSNFVQLERFQELFEALNAKNLSGKVFMQNSPPINCHQY